MMFQKSSIFHRAISFRDADLADFSGRKPSDFLEPEFYPDPGPFQSSMTRLTKDDRELVKNLASHKATIRVLAPYLQTMRQEKKRIIASAIKKKRRMTTVPEQVVDEQKAEFQYVRNAVPDLSDKVALITSVHDTADLLTYLLDAAYVVTYFVNPDKNELYQSPRHVDDVRVNLSRKIEPGTTISAYAAFTKHFITSTNIGTDQKFPLGLGYSETMCKYALCVPIKTPDDKVVAVYEVVRDAFQTRFEAKDVQTVLALVGWMGVAILQNALYTSSVKKLELTDYLTQLTNHYHSGQANIDKTISDVVVFARDVIGAERGNLYVVKKKLKAAVVLEEYDQGIEYTRGLFKTQSRKHIRRDGSLLSQVLFDKKVVFNAEYSLITNNEDVRCVLCVPVICYGETIGAIQMTNKKGSKVFTEDDKDTLQIFANFCAVNLSHLKVCEKHTKTEIRMKVLTEMLFHHIKPCSHDQIALTGHSDQLPDDFFSFSYYPSPDEMPKLVEYTINMLHDVLGDAFMALNNVPRFVLTVKNCYRPNPYHNFLHAFGVAHAMANIVRRYSRVFTGLERKALMVAALCHDVDHRGYNNHFLQLTGHHLADLYETSFLENHHFAVTKLVLQQCKMFKYFNSDMYEEFLEEIYELIIATDLSLYFQGRMEILKISDERRFTFKDPSHRRLVKNLLMTACDLSGQTKCLAVCQKITEDVYEEFYLQGDVEKNMGYTPLPTMNRDQREMIPENQVQFLSVVVLPCVETVSKMFNDVFPMYYDCKDLICEWRKLVEEKDEPTWRPESSVASAKIQLLG